MTNWNALQTNDYPRWYRLWLWLFPKIVSKDVYGEKTLTITAHRVGNSLYITKIN